MKIDLDLSEVDDIEKAAANEGGGNVKPGKAHVMVTGEVDWKASDNGSPVVVTLEVLAHEDRESVGSTRKAWLTTTGKGVRFLVAFYNALGVRTAAQMKADDWPDTDELAGRQMLCEFREEEYNGKKQIKLNVFEMHAVADAKKLGYPVNEGMLARQPKPGATAAPPSDGY